MLERVLRRALGVVGAEEAGDGVGNFFGAAAVANGTSDGSELADSSANAEIVGVDELAIHFDFFAFDADVGDPVLAATVGAAGDVELDVVAEAGEAVIELFGEPAGERLGFGESELAEFGAGAGNGAANEGRAFDGKASGNEFGDDGGDVGFGDVDEEKILHRSGAEVAVGETFGEIGGEAELRGSDASANDGSADRKEAGLLLGLHAEMIAMDLGGKIFRLGRIESEGETGLDGGEERVGGPGVFEEEIFEASAFAALAEDFAGAEEFGDGADYGDDLVFTDESV